MLLAVLLVLVAGQNVHFQSSPSQPEAVATACGLSPQGCVATESDGMALVPLSHAVYEDGCGQQDLHVVRYVVDGGSGDPLAVTFCG